MAASAATMLAPTLIGQGVETSLAFQRTDAAAAALGLTWLALAVTGAGVSRVGVALAALAATVAIACFGLLDGNPRLGDSGRLYLIAPPIAAMALALGRLVLGRGREQAPPPVRQAAAPKAPPAEPEAPAEAPNPEGAKPAPETAPAPGAAPAAANAMVVSNDPIADPDAAERLQFMRIRATEAGNTAAAVERWRAIAETFPDYYPAINSEARVLFQLNRLDEARARLERSLTIAPEDDTTLRLAARYAAAAEDWDAAAGYWERVAEVADATPEDAAALVSALTRAGRPEDAGERFRAFAGTWPENGRLVAAGALAAETASDHGAAFELWTAAAELEPTAFSHRRRAIRALIQLDRLEEARDLAAAYMADSGAEPEATAIAEQVARQIARKERAETAAETAPAPEPAPESLGETETASLDPKEDSAPAKAPEAELEAPAAAAPDDSDVDTIEAAAREAAAAGDHQTALANWGDVVRHRGVSGDAVLGSATALAGLGRHREADLFLERGLAELGEDWSLLLAWAENAEAAGDARTAEARWRRAIAYDPASERAWRGAAEALARQGDDIRAAAVEDEALAALGRRIGVGV